MRKWKLVLGWVFNLCILLGIGAVFYQSYQLAYEAFANEPFGKHSEKSITLEVKEGESQQDVADQLVEKGFLKNSIPFTFRYTFSEYRGKIKPGSYEISETMGIDDVLNLISQTEDKK